MFWPSSRISGAQSHAGIKGWEIASAACPDAGRHSGEKSANGRHGKVAQYERILYSVIPKQSSFFFLVLTVEIGAPSLFVRGSSEDIEMVN